MPRAFGVSWPPELQGCRGRPGRPRAVLRRASWASVGRVPERTSNVAHLSVAQDRQMRDVVAVLRLGDQAGQFGGAADGMAVQRQDDVAGEQAGLGRGPARDQVGDQGALGFLAQAHGFGQVGRHVLDRRAEIAAGDLAAGDQLLGDLVGDVGGDGEADAHRTAGGREDRRIDADHTAIDVEGRTARVAPVDRRVDLDEVDEAVADVAAIGRDDAGGGRAAQAEGVADGDDPVADARLGRVFEVHVGEARTLDLDHRKVGGLVAADHLGRQLALVGEHHLDVVGVLDDVVVGDDASRRGRDEEAGAGGLGLGGAGCDRSRRHWRRRRRHRRHRRPGSRCWARR